MRSTASALALALAAAPAWAQEPARGELLYATHCASCHSERLHAREKSKISSLSDLRDEVARWAPQTRHRFTLEEKEDVVRYLNRTHYKMRD